MGTLSLLFPISFSSSPRPKSHLSSRTHLRKRGSWHVTSWNTLDDAKIRGQTVVFGGDSSGQNESQFLDENGVVDDMDGYLNYLSLEYDSVWDTKPSWCQPWTIVLTGVLATGCSWLIFQSPVVTSVVLLVVCFWWYIFLYSYPKAYADMIAERRKRVTSGIEDTYGVEKIH